MTATETMTATATCLWCDEPVRWGETERGARGFVHDTTRRTFCSWEEKPVTCLNGVDGHWYVVTYGAAPYTIHAVDCLTCEEASA